MLSPQARACVAQAQRLIWMDNDAIASLAQSLDRLAQSTGSDYLLAWARGVHARRCILRGRPDDALELLAKVTEAAAAHPEDTDLTRFALRNRAEALLRLGRWAEMMVVQSQLLSLVRRTGDTAGEISHLTGIGAALAELGQSELAMTAFEQADELRADIPIDRTADKQRLESYSAALLSNLALAHLDRARLCRHSGDGAAAERHVAHAVNHARQARGHARRARTDSISAAIWDTVADCLLQQGRLHRARLAMRVAHHHAQRAGPLVVSTLQTTSACIALASNQPEQALQALSATPCRPEGAPASTAVLRCLQTLIAAHEACGQWEQAYRTQSQLLAAQRDLMSQHAQQRYELVQRQLAGERDDALRFLGHDLRAPLSSIIAGIDMLPEPESAALRHTLQRLRSYADRALRISAGVLAHLQSTRVDENSFEPVNLLTLVDDASAEVDAVAASKAVRITLRIDPLADRDGARTRGSREFLHRALINVIDNAVRFAPSDSDVTVALRPGGRYWRITVADSGPGFNGLAGISAVAPGLGVLLTAGAHEAASVHGLGRRLVNEVIVRHRGIVRLGRNEPHGALVELLLPMMPGEA